MCGLASLVRRSFASFRRSASAPVSGARGADGADWRGGMIYRGSTRTVITVGPLAFKFARGRLGMQCNRHEVDLYRRSSAKRRSMLCPVLWCSRYGLVLIMRRADTPVTQGALDERKATAWLEWDYTGPGNDAHPF